MSARYHWFQGATIAALRDALNAADDDARLEVHQDGESMTLLVVNPQQADTGTAQPLNESHVCPPFCP